MLRVKSKTGIALIVACFVIILFLVLGALKPEPRIPLRTREAALKIDLLQ